MRRSTDPQVLAATALFAAGVLVFGASLARALSVPEAERGAGPRGLESAVEANAPSSLEPDSAALPHSALMLAVDHDPFRPDRQRAPSRYLLPGESLPEPESPPPAPPPPPPFRLVGTAVTPEGGLALLQLENSPPRMVALGESLLGYTVTRVTNESAVLEGQQGQVLSLLLSRAVAVGPPDPRGQGGRQQGRAAQASSLLERAAQAREAAMVQERMNAINRILEQGGASSPALIEAMRRLLENAGPGLVGSDVRVEGGGNVIIRRTQPDTIIRPSNRNP